MSRAALLAQLLLTLTCYWLLLDFTPRLGQSALIDVMWAIMIPVTFVNTFLTFRTIVEALDKEKK